MHRLAADAIREQCELAQHEVAASATDSTYHPQRGADDALLNDLVKSLLALDRIPAAHERIHKSLKAELKRLVDEAAMLVGKRGDSSRDSRAAKFSRDGSQQERWEGTLKSPPSEYLCAFLELVFQMFSGVFYRFVTFTRLCDLVTGVAPGTAEGRMNALAETWRDMQDTVEQLVLKHLQEPDAQGEGSYSTAQLFQGTFPTKLSYTFNAQTEFGQGASGSGRVDKYAGSDFVRCSPYHIGAIYSQILTFAETGADLLATAGARQIPISACGGF